ncbi:MAG TPA: hypothetical protein ENN17_05485 [bacterium]|nr:hypothetical protein [bacterium]
MKKIPLIIVLLVFSAVFLHTLRIDSPAPDTAKQYLLEKGSEETGAVNLVTSIYLGYRAFDTLGETIILLVSVAGVIYLIGAKDSKE